MKNILSIQSHVVYGHAGNNAAVFPMQRMGVNVWPLNTVQFSNHTQYGHWRGSVMEPQQLVDIVEGINEIDQLARCDAILSGYIGSAEQGAKIIEIVNKIKTINPKAKYFCDPVMSHPDKGCIVADGVAEFFDQQAIYHCDFMAPNLLELEQLSHQRINTVKEAVIAARDLCQKGPQLILVKHLSKAGYDKQRFEMLLVTAKEAWHVSRPLIDFGLRQPVGVGDVTSGLMLVNLLLANKTLPEMLEHVAAATHGIITTTHQMKEYELQLIASQDKIVHPEHYFTAIKL